MFPFGRIMQPGVDRLWIEFVSRMALKISSSENDKLAS